MKIRKNDTVVVIAGNARGKKGKVLKVYPDRDRLIVEGVNIMKRHSRPSQKNPQGGIVQREAPIHVSNVMIVSPDDDKRTRIGSRLLPDGRRVRIGRRGGEVLDK